MTMNAIISEEARLIILRELDSQPDGRLNSSLLCRVLENFGITKPREWVHDELAFLATMGAVTVQDVGTVRIAGITSKGRDHVERRLVINGVKRPTPAGG